MSAALDGRGRRGLVVERLRVVGGAGAAPPEELFWAVRRLFEVLARERPLLVVLEDVHWAEPMLLDLVEHVSRWSRDAPILLLCVARPELLEEQPWWEGTTRHVRLEPLSPGRRRSSSSALAAAPCCRPSPRARRGGPGQSALHGIARRHARREARAAVELVALPPTIQALLAARLDRLDPFDREVLERAAVVGKEFWPGAVAALAGRQRDARANALGLLRRDSSARSSSIPGEDGFRFRHALIRDAAYAGIPKRTRADLHERFAGWIERHDGEDELVGYHLEQAYRYREELDAARRPHPVARRASGRAARLRAPRVRARRRTGGGQPPRARRVAVASHERIERQRAPRARDRTHEIGRLAAAEGALEEALDLAHADGDRRLELRTLIERESNTYSSNKRRT